MRWNRRVEAQAPWNLKESDCYDNILESVFVPKASHRYVRPGPKAGYDFSADRVRGYQFWPFWVPNKVWILNSGLELDTFSSNEATIFIINMQQKPSTVPLII